VRLYESIGPSIEPYTWELILVGPNDPPPELFEKPNFKFFKDFGTPARSAQIATTLAEGVYMTWGSDDGIFMPGALRECLDLYRNVNARDVITVRYCEGPGMTGKMPDDDYWKPWTHADQRLPGIPKEFWCAPVGMYNLDYFRWLGGWDCRFEHLNMCCHDLVFRAQRAGSSVHLSPSLVHSCDFNAGTGDHIPVTNAYHANDLPLFNSIYASSAIDRIRIDYFNWMSSPSKWARRFG
jgi:hypothetical protein